VRLSGLVFLKKRTHLVRDAFVFMGFQEGSGALGAARWTLAPGVELVMEGSSTVVAWVDGEFTGWVSDRGEGIGKIDEGVASLGGLRAYSAESAQ
jgi:hypothetical protein